MAVHTMGAFSGSLTATATPLTLGKQAGTTSGATMAPCEAYQRAVKSGMAQAVLDALKSKCLASSFSGGVALARDLAPSAPAVAAPPVAVPIAYPEPEEKPPWVLIAAGVGALGLAGLVALKLRKRRR